MFAEGVNLNLIHVPVDTCWSTSKQDWHLLVQPHPDRMPGFCHSDLPIPIQDYY